MWDVKGLKTGEGVVYFGKVKQRMGQDWQSVQGSNLSSETRGFLCFMGLPEDSQ